MSTLRQQVAAFQIAPKYNICIGEDNADLLIGLISDGLKKEETVEMIAEIEEENNEHK